MFVCFPGEIVSGVRVFQSHCSAIWKPSVYRPA
jgi:hypothetical protein